MENHKIESFFVNAEQAMHWPNTPGHKALKRAELAYEQLYQAHPSQVDHLTLEDFTLAEQYDILIHTGAYRDQATRRFHHTFNSTPEHQLISLVLRTAIAGNTPDTIGMAIAVNLPGGKGSYSFTQLLRHPHWMGLDAALPRIKGLRAIIFPDKTNNQPAAVVATAPGNITTRSEAPFPPGQATILKDLLSWHGADPVWTNPYSG